VNESYIQEVNVYMKYINYGVKRSCWKFYEHLNFTFLLQLISIIKKRIPSMAYNRIVSHFCEQSCIFYFSFSTIFFVVGRPAFS